MYGLVSEMYSYHKSLETESVRLLTFPPFQKPKRIRGHGYAEIFDKEEHFLHLIQFKNRFKKKSICVSAAWPAACIEKPSSLHPLQCTCLKSKLTINRKSTIWVTSKPLQNARLCWYWQTFPKTDACVQV